MAEHHPTLPPSSFPALAECPCYESSSESSEAANRGTLQHAATVERLCGESEVYKLLGAQEQSAVDWVLACPLKHLSAGTVFEERIEILDDNFEVLTFGTIDILESNPLAIADLKFGEVHAYWPQLIVYALGAMDRMGTDTCKMRIIYGRLRRVDERTITRTEARDFVNRIAVARIDPKRRPHINDFCGWCRHNGTCPAQIDKAVEIVRGRAEPVHTYHPSQVTSPSLMAELLIVAKSVSAFADSVKHHALEMALKGDAIPGYEICERRGAPKIIDVNEAFNRLGLPPEEFVKATSPSIPKLGEIYAAANNLNKVSGRRKVDELLNGIVERKPPSKFLKRTGEDETDASD